MRARLNCVCSLYHLRANMAENNDLRLSPLAEALRCLGLGLRGSLLLRAAAYSLGVWLLSVLLWVVVFFFAWDAVAPHLAPAAWPLWLQMLWRFLAGAVLFVALVFVTMRLLLDFFLIEIINREVEKSYALAPRCTPPPLYSGTHWRNILRPWAWLVLLPPLLFIPFLGPPLILLLLSFISVNALLPDTFARIAPAADVAVYARRDRRVLLCLSIFLALLALIPFNFLMPWILGSTVSHYSQRAVWRRRQPQLFA